MDNKNHTQVNIFYTIINYLVSSKIIHSLIFPMIKQKKAIKQEQTRACAKTEAIHHLPILNTTSSLSFTFGFATTPSDSTVTTTYT